MLTGGLLAGQGMNGWAVRPAVPILARFLGKFVLDIMPAALASVIGGFLFTQYQFGHTPAQHPAAEAVAPASAEMLALVRDEHAMIVDYLKSQMAAEKSREAAQTRDAEAIAGGWCRRIRCTAGCGGRLNPAPRRSDRRIAAGDSARQAGCGGSRGVCACAAGDRPGRTRYSAAGSRAVG